MAGLHSAVSVRLLVGAWIACAVCISLAAAQTPPQAVPTSVPMPDNGKMALLIQTHMAALSHANLTGNYSVLRALGSPAFQAANSTDQLAANFSTFRTQGIDISPTILWAPILFGPPKLEGTDILRVTGQYDTHPQRVVFEMAFQAVNNAWRLAGIAVRTLPADQAKQAGQGGAQTTPATPPTNAAKSAAPAKK